MAQLLTMYDPVKKKKPDKYSLYPVHKQNVDRLMDAQTTDISVSQKLTLSTMWAKNVSF